MKKIFFTYILIFITASVSAQIGGGSTFSFLEMSASPYANSLGGKLISSTEAIDLVFYNPALLDSLDSNHITFSYQSYLANIQLGDMIFTTTMHKYGNLAFGVHYINYGKFEQYDEFENYYGTFTASEYVPFITYSLQPDSQLTIGINFKPIYSKLENYYSYGYSIDLGLFFKANDFLNLALSVRNIGKQIKPYYTTYEPLPFNISAGITGKPKYAPFRINFTLDYLNKWNLRYKSPVNQLYLPPFADTVSAVYKITSALDEFMRHSYLGVEVILSPHFNINIGYNYRRAKELYLPTIRTTNGFSFGLSIFTSKVNIYYSAQKIMRFTAHSFSISLNLNSLYFSRKHKK